jgi:uncharacterized protein (DUF1330 family)
MMTAYLIVDLDVHDKEGFQEYRDNVARFVTKHGGRFIVRRGEIEVFEGDFKPHVLAIMEFPNMQAIRDLRADEGYLKLAEVRRRTAKTIVIGVGGID